MNKVTTALGFLVVLFLASTAQAATFYVSKSGSDSNNCTKAQTLATAKLTIQAGVNCTSAAGDVVTVKAGTYTEQIGTWPVAGTAGNPITLTAAAGETVTLNGASPMITVTNRSYIKINGFAIGATGNVRFIRFLNATGNKTTNPMVGIEVRNNTFTGSGVNGLSAPVGTSSIMISLEGVGHDNNYTGVDDSFVTGNTFTNTYGTAVALSGSSDVDVADNTVTGTLGSQDSSNGNAFIARVVMLTDTTINSLTVNNRRNTIERNTASNFQTASYITNIGGTFVADGIRGDSGASNNTIQDNVVTGMADANAWSFQNRGFSYFFEARCNDNLFQRNIAANDSEACYQLGSAVNSANRNYLVNNDCYSAGKIGIELHNAGSTVVRNNTVSESTEIQIAVSQLSVTLGGNVFKNNNYFKTGNSLIGYWNWPSETSPFFYSATQTLAQWNTSSGETNSLNADPTFASPITDFHLQSSSTLIGAGYGGMDIGAYISKALYYVTTTGSDTNDGMVARPFATIQKGGNVANPGDTILVDDGTYTVNTAGGTILYMQRSGTAGNPITFRSINKWGAKLNGQNQLVKNGIVVAANYVTVQGFEVYGVGQIGGTGIEFNGNNDTALQNDVHDVGRECTDSVYGLDAFYIDDLKTNIRITQNLIHDIGRFNPGENGCSPANTYYQNHDHGVYVNGGSNIIIDNNYFYKMGHGWQVHFYPATTSNIQVTNNTFGQPTNTYIPSQLLLAGNMTTAHISNNIFYQPNASAIDHLSGTLSGVLVENNVTTVGVVVQNDAGTGGYTLSNNKTNTDPLFVNAATFDYHLTSTSPAIDEGLTFANDSPDWDGVARPQRNAFDAGAFELPGGVSTYYVAPATSGGSDSNPGTIGSPFLTPHKAELVTHAGDTVYFRGGTYRHSCCNNSTTCPDPLGAAPDGIRLMYIQHGGTVGAPITYKAYPGETPVFEGRHYDNGDLNGDGNEDGPYINAGGQFTCYGDGTSNYTNPPFQVVGSTNNERLIEVKYGVEYVVIDGLTLKESNRYSFILAEDPANLIMPADHITFQNNTVYNGWDNAVFVQGNNNTLTNNIIHHIQHGTGLVLHPNDKSITTHDTVVSSNISYRNGYRADGRRVQPAAGDSAGGGNSDGFQCYKDCGLLAAVAGSADSPALISLCRRETFENNVAWGNADDGFDISCTQSYIHNNISISNGGTPDGWGTDTAVNGDGFKVFLTAPRPYGNNWVQNLSAFNENTGFSLRDTSLIDTPNVPLVFLHNTAVYNGHGGTTYDNVSSLAIDGAIMANNLMSSRQSSGSGFDWRVTQLSVPCTTCRNTLLDDTSGVEVGGTNIKSTDPLLIDATGVFKSLTSTWRHMEVPIVGATAAAMIANIRQPLLDKVCPGSSSAAIDAGVSITWTRPTDGVLDYWHTNGKGEDIGFCETRGAAQLQIGH